MFQRYIAITLLILALYKQRLTPRIKNKLTLNGELLSIKVSQYYLGNNLNRKE
jgi:hypothetical protein